MASTLLSSEEKRYITKGIEVNVRTDGRGREQLREAQLDLDVVPLASGSARVRLGGSDVIVAIKADLDSPQQDRPNEGRLAFSVECSPLASSSFRGRGGDELASELTKALERSMYPGTSTSNSGFPLHLDTLSVVPGKCCWVLYIDGLVLDLDGNILDVLSFAVKAALAHARIPKVEVSPAEVEGEEPEYEIDDDPQQASRLDTANVPVVLTACQIGGRCVLDPTIEEYSCASAAIQVAVDAEGAVCGMTKRKGGGVDTAMLLEILSVVQRNAARIHGDFDTLIAQKLKGMSGAAS